MPSWRDLAGHGAELGYVFDNRSVGYAVNYQWDLKLAKVMSHHWSEFTVSGRPATEDVWPQYYDETDNVGRAVAQHAQGPGERQGDRSTDSGLH